MHYSGNEHHRNKSMFLISQLYGCIVLWIEVCKSAPLVTTLKKKMILPLLQTPYTLLSSLLELGYAFQLHNTNSDQVGVVSRAKAEWGVAFYPVDG